MRQRREILRSPVQSCRGPRAPSPARAALAAESSRAADPVSLPSVEPQLAAAVAEDRDRPVAVVVDDRLEVAVGRRPLRGIVEGELRRGRGRAPRRPRGRGSRPATASAPPGRASRTTADERRVRGGRDLERRAGRDASAEHVVHEAQGKPRRQRRRQAERAVRGRVDREPDVEAADPRRNDQRAARPGPGACRRAPAPNRARPPPISACGISPVGRPVQAMVPANGFSGSETVLEGARGPEPQLEPRRATPRGGRRRCAREAERERVAVRQPENDRGRAVVRRAEGDQRAVAIVEEPGAPPEIGPRDELAEHRIGGDARDAVLVGEVRLARFDPSNRPSARPRTPSRGSGTASPTRFRPCRPRELALGGSRRRRIIPLDGSGFAPETFWYRARTRDAIPDAPPPHPAVHAAILEASASAARESDRRAPDRSRGRGTDRGRNRACIRVAILSEAFSSKIDRDGDDENHSAHSENFLLARAERGLEYGPSLIALRGDSTEKRGSAYGKRLQGAFEVPDRGSPRQVHGHRRSGSRRSSSTT